MKCWNKGMRLQLFVFRFLSFLILFVSGCDDRNAVAPEKDYFPLRSGLYWEYDVEEIIYTPFNPPASLSYQLRIIVADSVGSSEGGYIYVWHCFRRTSDAAAWQFSETWSARKYAGYALVAEGNTTYARLAFPVYVNRTWDGNLFNSLGADNYRIAAKSAGMVSPLGLSFNEVVEVEQENVSNNLTYRDVRKEWYSNGIGLVRKESEVWTYRCSGGTCTGEIESGYALRINLKDYGRE